MRRYSIIGLDRSETEYIADRLGDPVQAYEVLPRIIVQDSVLSIQSDSGFQYRPADKVVFHGIFADDHDTIAGLAIWGGPCLPNAHAMMDCRLKLPCLVRALQYTQFASPIRSFVSAGAEFALEESLPSRECVAKWGNWHCGENKHRFSDRWTAEEASVVEPFLDGEAIRVVVIGDRSWQIRLAGNDWLKSIHHAAAEFVTLDASLDADTRAVAAGFGLEIAANDYIVTSDGVPHLLEVNHIPNVTRFPEIWDAYVDYVVDWLRR